METLLFVLGKIAWTMRKDDFRQQNSHMGERFHFYTARLPTRSSQSMQSSLLRLLSSSRPSLNQFWWPFQHSQYCSRMFWSCSKVVPRLFQITLLLILCMVSLRGARRPECTHRTIPPFHWLLIQRLLFQWLSQATMGCQRDFDPILMIFFFWLSHGLQSHQLQIYWAKQSKATVKN